MTLRNPNINYSDGWFFVTTQVAHNKTIFGAIVGKRCELNELGRRVEMAWRTVPEHRKEVRLDAFVVMPNHFHAVVRMGTVPHAHESAVGQSQDQSRGFVARSPNLSYVMQTFKSFTSHLYLELQKEGLCVDIGPKLWQSSFYDNLITTHGELENIRTYIRNNPACWEGDRFGPVTSYSRGNTELLLEPLVAFVASDTERGNFGVDTQYRSIYRRSPTIEASEHCPPRPVISTFTSAGERDVLEKCIKTRRGFVWVMPGGIPEHLPQRFEKPIAGSCGLALSPVPSGTGVNKQRAIWCNQYVLRHAEEIWCGAIRPGGTLETLLQTINGK